MLNAYARICHYRQHHGTEELRALLHRGEQVDRVQQQLLDLFRELLTHAAGVGAIRSDVGSDELANYCLHALAAAGSLSSEAAVERLVTISLAGLQPDA